MNHLRQCLRCWIPASDKKKDSVVQNADEAEHSDRSSISSSRNVPPSQSTATRRPSSVTLSSVDEASPVAGAESSNDGADNYIALDKCFSGSRSTKIQTMPRLVQRDIRLLDLVPPSPCSMIENLGGLSGMPEVYAPMSPCKISRGSLGGAGMRVIDSPNKVKQLTPQGRRRELFNFDVRTDENPTGSNLSLKSDLRNIGSQDDHGLHRFYDGAEFRKRILCASMSSDASIGDHRAYCPSSKTSHSLRGSPSGHADRPHYCNICTDPTDDDIAVSHNCQPDATGEFSDTDARRTSTDANSRGRDRCNHSDEALKILHMTPPAPSPQKNRLKMHKYVNARDGQGFPQCFAEGAEPSRSVQSSAKEYVMNDCDGYYNILPSTGQSSKAERASTPSPPPPPIPPPPSHGHSSSHKKPLKPKLNPYPKDPLCQLPDSVILPVRKKSTNNEDPSSSEDDGDSCNNLSPAHSNVSISKAFHSFPLNGFTSKPPAPPQPPTQSIEYLQLDLTLSGGGGSRGSPGAIHRAINSTPIDYIKIDPFRTKALSEAKRQFESNRQNGKMSH